MPEQFIKPVLTIIAIAMLLWLVFSFIFSRSEKTRHLKISRRAELTVFLFYLYIVGVLSLTIIPLPFARFKTLTENAINVVPVVNIVKGVVEIISAKEDLSEHSFQNLVGNVILFIPLGIFLPLLSTRYHSIGKIAVQACICSVSIELTQLILRQFEINRSVDIDDVILNTTGAVLGFMLINWFYLKKK